MISKYNGCKRNSVISQETNDRWILTIEIGQVLFSVINCLKTEAVYVFTFFYNSKIISYILGVFDNL